MKFVILFLSLILSQIIAISIRKLDAKLEANAVLSETLTQQAGTSCNNTIVIDPAKASNQTIPFNTTGFALTSPAQCSSAGTAYNVFFTITPRQGSTLLLDVNTFNSAYNTILGAYPCGCSYTRQYSCNDNALRGKVLVAQSEITVNVTACTLFIVSGFMGAKGTGVLNVNTLRVINPPTAATCPTDPSTITPGTSCTQLGTTCSYLPYCCCGTAPTGTNCYNTSFYTCSASGTWSPNAQTGVNCQGVSCAPTRIAQPPAAATCPSNASTITPGTSCTQLGATCGYSPYCCCGTVPTGTNCYNTSFYTCSTSGTWSPNAQAAINCQGVSCTSALSAASPPAAAAASCPSSTPTPMTSCSIPSTWCYYDPTCCCQGTSNQICGNTTSIYCGSSQTWSPLAQSSLSPCNC